MIPNELLEKHGITNIEFIEREIDIYYLFLSVTDYICCKIMEGVATWEDYADEKKYREVAREQIRKLNV